MTPIVQMMVEAIIISQVSIGIAGWVLYKLFKWNMKLREKAKAKPEEN